ncbi:hypothetical protein EW146_g1638 [Bondarzewia mesenterica]|uniref:homogentisate 1,2-dioxygenase n=1 Tax=Bondarzewia mesenterica TaxID=1095465 RepID=A0A4S4M393_9AGAM|nr:hypothetical protein EW146_g1638 [Bondarzewia mesenterica]
MTSTCGATAQASFGTMPTPTDPYRYQVGFGNRFASEAIPGTLPIARNTPQKLKYDLYPEQLNGSAFVSSRATLQNVWMYRIRPSVAHRGLTRLPNNPDVSFSPLALGLDLTRMDIRDQQLEANFSLSNPDIEYVPSQLAWDPFSFPSSTQSVDFVDGIKTIAGQGDPSLNEGLAVHIYSANTSMDKKAFCSNDGDMLILPQQGRMDIQTEFGNLMVRPGELVVVQRGMRFKVKLPDGPVRGYIQEVFGSHYELAELGPLGSNGMALQRDFESPIASFDIDQTPWESGYVPYKYAIEKFINVGCVEKDQMDPTVYCVLTAKSKVPGVSISDFLVFTPKWSVTTNTFRPPELTVTQYYHRNMSTEVMGLLYGVYGGSSHVLEPGGLSYEASFMPHGETYDTFLKATTMDLKPTRVNEDTIGVTKYALERSGRLHETPATIWDDLEAHFNDHIDEINQDLRAAGLPLLGER